MAFWDSWKRRNAPNEKHYGGSKEATAELRKESSDQIRASQAQTRNGLDAADAAAGKTRGQFDDLNSDLRTRAAQQDYDAQAARRGFDSSMSDYGRGRQATLDTARKIEAEADALASNYQQTADKQFQANQARSTRSALTVASRGGAAGIRAAVAGSTNANADAAAQAEVTRANELNQLAQMKQGALTTAAQLRAGVSAQDQQAASQYSGRQQNAYGNQLATSGQMSGNYATEAGVSQNAASLAAGTGLAREQAWLESRGNMENAQLNASREAEQLRQQGRTQRFNRIRDPFGLNGS